MCNLRGVFYWKNNIKIPQEWFVKVKYALLNLFARGKGEQKWQREQVLLENKELHTLNTTHDTTPDIYPWCNPVSKHNSYQVYSSLGFTVKSLVIDT